jgi:ABC-type transport system involved in multi-copper enzyme maturation permease subunit
MNATVFAETLRRHVTSIPYVAYLAFLAMIGLAVSKFNAVGAAWPTLVALLAIVIGAGLIGPEFSSGTLQLILAKPVNRSVYLLSRVAGVVAAVWIGAVVASSFEALGHALFGGSQQDPWRLLGAALLNSAASAVLTCSLLAFLGSITRSYINVAIYMVLQIGLGTVMGILGLIRGMRGALSRFLTDNTWIERGLATIDRNLFPEVVPRLDRDWLLLVLSNAAIALVLACLAFRRREVPYGAD